MIDYLNIRSIKDATLNHSLECCIDLARQVLVKRGIVVNEDTIKRLIIHNRMSIEHTGVERLFDDAVNLCRNLHDYYIFLAHENEK